MLDDNFKIYAIRCKENKKMYIGRTKQELIKRINGHLTLLRGGKHTNKVMQEDFNKYGEDAFEYYELESNVKFEDRSRESFYMDRYKTCDSKYGYNTKDNHSRARESIKIIKGQPDFTE